MCGGVSVNRKGNRQSDTGSAGIAEARMWLVSAYLLVPDKSPIEGLQSHFS